MTRSVEGARNVRRACGDSPGLCRETRHASEMIRWGTPGRVTNNFTRWPGLEGVEVPGPSDLSHCDGVGLPLGSSQNGSGRDEYAVSRRGGSRGDRRRGTDGASTERAGAAGNARPVAEAAADDAVGICGAERLDWAAVLRM